MLKQSRTLLLIGMFGGCTTLFGWDIHAPGMMSGNFAQRVSPEAQRIALYLDPQVYAYQSKDRGGATADPQTFHIGEAYAPMIVEGFQQAFDEFIFLEVEPTAPLLKQYGIPRTAVVRIKDFKNKVTWKGQGVRLITETVVLGPDLNELGRFESAGGSDVEKVFAKKGGPEVNLNAALEHNVTAIVQYIQDAVRTGKWK